MGGKTRSGGRARSNSGVDVKAINARLERWAEEIASKFKRGKRGRHGEDEDGRLEIHHTVFQAPEGVRPATAQSLARPQDGVMTKEEFDIIIESVRLAIEQGVHPRMISQGSSGSYFARNPDGKVVGVFKPKDEEPYAAGNPKWNKWIHRNLFPCCFGRAWFVYILWLVFIEKIADKEQSHPQSFLRERSGGIHAGLSTTDPHGSLHRCCVALLQIIPLSILGSLQPLEKQKIITSQTRQFSGLPQRLQGCESVPARAPVA